MANGGFKAFQVEVAGIGSSATLANKKTAASTVLQEIGTKLVALGEGWSYDSECSSTGVPCAYPAGAFSDMGNTPQTLYLGFVHTNGTKMLMTYNVYYTGYAATNFTTSGSLYYSAGALAISMIPNGLGTYNYNSSSPIPTKGLKLQGSAYNYNGAITSFIYTADEGEKLRYTIIVRQNQIVVVSQKKSGSEYDKTGVNVRIYGDVLSSVQTGDTLSQKNFATIDHPYVSTESTMSLTNSYYAFTNNYPITQFFNISGDIFNSNDDSCYSMSDKVACNCIQSISNTARFFPIHVYSSKTGGISSTGDGYKGTVNPEVACIITKDLIPMGTLLDSGNFIMLLGGLVVGWDPSNTVNFN